MAASMYQQRRKHVMEQIGKNGIAILEAAPAKYRTQSAEYPYRQQNDFYYLTGFKEPEALLVLMPGGPEGDVVLFNRTNDPDYEVWHGRMLGHDGAVRELKVDKSLPITDVKNMLPDLINGRDVYALQHDKALLKKIHHWLHDLHGEVSVKPLDEILDPLRLIKTDEELALIQKAVDISVAAHTKGMQCVKPGMTEYELAAEYEYIFKKSGNSTPAYDCIVGGGENACILHYRENADPLNDGEMVLVDAGAEYQCYASDITRTYPVNGRFTAQQKDVYNIVLEAQLRGIEATKPGAAFVDIQKLVVEILTRGLVDLKLLKGSVDELIEKGAYKQYYMHSSGHWMGLDVHDVGKYKAEDKPRPYQAGMVLTVEPGLYIPEWKLGIRIEDDVLVTPTGSRVLSEALPKTVKDIEACMMSP